MAVNPSTPISVIEGIGPVIATALESIHVITVFDLLRRSEEQLYQAVKSLASAEQVRTWKSMDSLLQVLEITPQFSEALVRNDVQTICELQRSTFTGISELMTRAVEQHLISNAPTPNQITEMLKDAAIISRTGSVNGTILDSDRQPVSGATARIGFVQTQSDDRGRFRLLRIPLGWALTLDIEHPDFHPFVDVQPRITRDSEVIEIQIFRMTRVQADDGPPAPERFSELNGDVLPINGARRFRLNTINAEQLRDGDVLMVREFYSSSPHAQLVSRLKSYENGEIIVQVVRLPLSRLPGEVKLRDHFRFSGNKFIRVDITNQALHQYKTRLQLRKVFAGRPQPQTIEELRAEMRFRFDHLIEAGIFGTRRTPS